MRIALLLESDGPGGAEKMVFHLAEGLVSRGHTVLPVGPERGVGWLGELFRKELHLEPASFRLRRAFDPACVADLMRMFRRKGVDVVHSHESAMGSYGTVAARLSGLPAIITLHSAGVFLRKGRTRAAMRWSIHAADAVTTISDATRDAITSGLRLRSGGLQTIPNGVPIPEGDGSQVRSELGVDEATSLILAVGNLYHVKGHDILIRALALVAQRRPDLPWVAAIAGRGEEHASLLALLESLGLSKRVKFLGVRSDVGALLNGADIFVQPSRSEGMPLSVIEAMRAGLPVIASDVGGLGEMIASGGNGELVPSEDPQELASRLERLLEHPRERARLGCAAKVSSRDRFGLDSMVERYLHLYRSLSGRRERPS
jgi:L-malate glycosyltransferase